MVGRSRYHFRIECLPTHYGLHSLQKLFYKVSFLKTFKSNERLILATYPKNVEQLESCVFDPVVASDVSKDTKPPHSTFVFYLNDVKEANLNAAMVVKK